MRPALSLRLFGKSGKCFGPGIARLLQEVHAHRSLRAAAQSMQMAYSKAWRIVKDTEQALGLPLLDSAKGGVHGGGATLTAEGEALLNVYLEYERALRQEAERLYAEYFYPQP